MDTLKKLQDEAVALANRIDAVRALESTDADKIAERDLELETLNADAAKLAKKIDFETFEERKTELFARIAID